MKKCPNCKKRTMSFFDILPFTKNSKKLTCKNCKAELILSVWFDEIVNTTLFFMFIFHVIFIDLKSLQIYLHIVVIVAEAVLYTTLGYLIASIILPLKKEFANDP